MLISIISHSIIAVIVFLKVLFLFILLNKLPLNPFNPQKKSTNNAKYGLLKSSEVH